jgi:hypothetical protein
MAEISQDILQGLPGRLREKGVARNGKGFQIINGDLGVIVKHFFKMRHMPALVRGIAREPAAQVVKNSAASHGPKRIAAHFQGLPGFILICPFEIIVVAQQEIVVDGHGKFGSAAKAPQHGIKIHFVTFVAGL